MNAVPEDWRDYRFAYALARALEELCHYRGSRRRHPLQGDKSLLRAIEVLESVREEGRDKASGICGWRMPISISMGRKAIPPYAQRWAELDPEDENAPAVIRECKAEIRKRQRSRKEGRIRAW